jgi:REP element-mobilizing transposase RayT
LFETKKRFGLDILNYTVTSNHIHLLLADGENEVIPKSIQLVAGKTAQHTTAGKRGRGRVLGRQVSRDCNRDGGVFSTLSGLHRFEHGQK